MSDLDNKTFWITGASSGIGAATARVLAAPGRRIALTARRRDALEALAEELRKTGATVEVHPADVTDRQAVLSAGEHIAASLGAVDVLFSCAGDYEPFDATKFDSARIEHTMRVNYSGTMHCVQAVLPAMIARRAGYLVIVSSIVGYRGLPNSSPYSATKAALINFFEGLRFDLKRHRIDVSLVNPGFVKTDLTDKNEFPMPFRITAPEAAQKIVAGMEKRRREIHFPWQFTWTMKLLRVIPFPIYSWLIQSKVAK